MDPELGARIDALNLVIGMLIGATLLAACWIAREPLPDRKPDEPTCPLHKQPRSKCSPESHE
jgi:hypothetical protein